MPDFGEVLADIRDHFADPLPFRVNPLSVFTAVLLESLGSMVLRPMGYRSPIRMPDFDGDLDTVKRRFDALRNLPCSLVQIEQAEDTLHETLTRFQIRIRDEHETWYAAARAGAFLGTLVILLLLTSTMMCILTHRVVGVVFLALVIAIEMVASVVCARHWHY